MNSQKNDTHKEFLSCDWGTSNFRLRVIRTPELEVLAEETSDEGVSKVLKDWQATNDKDDNKRAAFYFDILKKHIAQLEKKLNRTLDGVQVVISGMASSSIGFADLPYQPLPISTDGTDMQSKTFKATDDFKHEVLLLSGVKSDDDVMRGEETQLIGCIKPDMDKYDGEQLFVHPGTHSKHITVKDKHITAFKTFMTGEFFKLLSTQSILHENVAEDAAFKKDSRSFASGVRDSLNANLLHAAFRVRTNDLFKKLTKKDNCLYLSGLLIGYELQELKHSKAKIYLASGASLADQYALALSTLEIEHKVTVLPPEWVDESVIRGQYKILTNNKNVYHEQKI